MILKTSKDTVQADVCGFVVTLHDMSYDMRGNPCICKFCERQAKLEKERIAKVVLPVVIEWAMTPTELVDVIRDAMGRRTAKVRMSCAGDG